MTPWTSHELDAIATADELRITPLRPDGVQRRSVPIWVVRDGDHLYIRSYRGTDGAWYQAAQASHRARISAGGITKDVTLAEEPEPSINDRIDAAYRTKYSRYGSTYVTPMVAAPARATTFKLQPE
jgi:hypothetical protein